MTTLDLYRTAVAADEAFEAALQTEGFTRWSWGNRAENDRATRAYRAKGSNAIEHAYRAKRTADDALHAAYAQLNGILD